MEENQVKKEEFSKLESIVIDFAQSRVDESRDEYETLYFVDGQLREDANEEEVKAKEEEIKGLEKETENLKSQLKKYKEAVAKYEKKMLEFNKEIDKLEKELEKIAKELEEAQKEDPIDEEKIAELTAKREETEGKLAKKKEEKDKTFEPIEEDYNYTDLIGWLMQLLLRDKGLDGDNITNGTKKYLEALTCEYKVDACKEMNDELQKEEEELYGEHEELNEDKKNVVQEYNDLVKMEEEVAAGAGAGAATQEPEQKPQPQPQQPPRPQPQSQPRPQPQQAQPAVKPEPQTRVNPEPQQKPAQPAPQQPAPAAQPKPTRAEIDQRQNELMKKLKEIESRMNEISEKIADIQDTQKIINDRIQENEQQLYTIEAELYTLLEMDPAELDRTNESDEIHEIKPEDLENPDDLEQDAPYKIDISKTVTIDFSGVVCEFNPKVVREARHVTGSDIEEILSLAEKYGTDDVTLQELIDSKKIDVSLIKLMQLNDEITEDNVNLMISDYIKANMEPKTPEQIEEQKEFAGLFNINYDLRKGLNASLFQARLSNEDKSRVVEAAKWGVRTGIVDEIPADKDYRKSLMERIRDIRLPWQEKVEALPEPSSMKKDIRNAQEHAEEYNDMLNDEHNETQSDIIAKAVVDAIETGDKEVLDLAKDGEVKEETDIERIRRIEQERKARAAENARNAAHRETDDSRIDRSDDDFEDIE